MEPIICGTCKTTIGDPVEIFDRVLLETDTLIIRHVSAVCKKCGAPFHFSITDHQLAELLGEVKAMRGHHQE